MPAWKRNITVFFAGQTSSMIGQMLVGFAVMWHLTLRTQSGTVVTWFIVASALPQALISPFGGALADRFNRKYLVMAANGGVAVLTAILAVIMAAGVDRIWFILLIMGVRSALAGIGVPAASALIPTLVPEGQLLRINSLNESIASAAMMLSPLFTAGLYVSIGLLPVFWFDVGMGAASVAILAFLPGVRSDDDAAAASDAPRTRPLKEIVAGLRYVRRNPTVRWLVIIYAFAMAFVAAPAFLTPLMVVRAFGDEMWRLTANELAWAGGGLVISLILAAVGARLKRHLLAIVAALALTGLLSLVLGLATNPWVFYALVFAVAAAFTAINVPEFTMLQQRVAPEMLGRVFGFVGLVASTVMPLAMVALGPLADRVSVQVILQISGASLMIFVAGLLACPQLRRLMADKGDADHVSEAIEVSATA